MKTEVKREDIERDFSPEMMEFLLAMLQTGAHEDAITGNERRKPVDKQAEPPTS